MDIIVETFRNPGEPTSRAVRVRPVKGQFAVDYRVWCSVQQRESKSIGSLFRVPVTLVHQPDGNSYLRVELYIPFIPVSKEEARVYLANSTIVREV